MGPGGRGDASAPRVGAPGLQKVQSPLTGVKAAGAQPCSPPPGAEPSSGLAHDLTKASGGQLSISRPPKGREKSPNRTRSVMQTQIS